MYSLAALAVFASSAITGVAAHGGVIGYTIAGRYYPGFRPYDNPSSQTTIQRPWSSHNPIENPGASTLACNNNGQSGSNQLTATVQAGQSVEQHWNHIWPHAQGPVLTYLAKCPGSTCTGVNSNSLRWFKIQEAGLISGTVGRGFWAAEQMQNDNSSWTTVIPSSVPSGHYLLRSETIAIHSVPSQFYPECAQIEITGGGSREPSGSELVSFPGGYSASQPGINININSQQATTQTTYVIPGPPLYGGAGGGPSYPPTSNPPTTNPPTTNPPTTQPPTQPPTTNPPTSTGGGGTVAQYGQCGGIGWTGATACQSPYTCNKLNDYYSQCL